MMVDARLWALWPFASSALLLWGLAAAIPLIIHLWSRRRYQEQSWAAMAFLLAALRRHARRLWLEQWLLLSLRCGILLLFALALADPILNGSDARVSRDSDDSATHWILVADVSYSMDYRQGERSSLDMVREQFTRIVRESRQGDGFSLILLADPPRVVIGEPTFDPSALLDELQSVSVSHGGADLPATLEEVARVSQEARDRYPRLARRQLVLASDLGRATWKSLEDEVFSRAWTRAIAGATASLVDVGAADAQNLAVTQLAPRDALVVAGRATQVEAVIRNFGTRDVAGVTVEFQSATRLLGSQTLDVPAGGQVAASVSVAFETPGDQEIAVRLSSDALPLDNQRWLSIPVSDQYRVLCVEGRLDEARFLALALNPWGGEQSPVRVDVAAETALLERTLRTYDLVCLCNVSRVTRDEVRALHSYVVEGGQLAVFVGDQVQVERYNLELVDGVGAEASPGSGESSAPPHARKFRLLPARLAPPIPGEAPRIDPLDYRDPLVAPFRGQERSGLLSTPIWHYLPTRVIDPESARIVVAFDNGDPWIIREGRGRGQVWLFTTDVSGKSLDRSRTPPIPWTAWPTWPSFVPLVQQLLRESLAGRGRLRNVLVGEPLEGIVPLTGAPEEVMISLPVSRDGGGEGPVRRLATEARLDGLAWQLPATTEIGTYVVRASGSGYEQRHCVNLDTRESDLERVDMSLLPAELRGEPPRPDQETPSINVGSEHRLFRSLLSLVVVLLVAETLLAWKFGARTAGQFISKAGSALGRVGP